jgi:hypothetical protein
VDVDPAWIERPVQDPDAIKASLLLLLLFLSRVIRVCQTVLQATPFQLRSP